MVRKKVVYLSGPISGKTNYLKLFAKHERELEKLGYAVMNPTKLDDPKKPLSWAECIIRDLGYLLLCDSIALLPGWHLSDGSRMEVLFAIKLGKRFIIRPGAVSKRIFTISANHKTPKGDTSWDNEDDTNEEEDKEQDNELEGGLDDIPGWDK